MKPLKNGFIAVVLAALLLSMAACDSDKGGGGTVTPPGAPVLSMTLQSIKTFHFSWADVTGETQYQLFEKLDGLLAYTQVATIGASATSYDYVAFLPNKINASYILKACNSGGCTDSAAISVSGNLIDSAGYVKASDTGEADQFGYSIALSDDGNTLAVGAPKESSNAKGIINADQYDDSAPASGAVYVFTRSGTAWSQEAYVKASNSESNDEFGWHVDLSADGNTLAVSAIFEDSYARGIKGDELNNSATDSGAVYVFTRDNGSWSQQAYVKASNTGSMDYFGYSFALSDDGNTLVVGAPRDDSRSTGINGDQNDYIPLMYSDSGAAYVFTRSNSTWSQQAYVKASNTGSEDLFGYSIALSADGNTLAIGAAWEDSSDTGINGNQFDNSANKSGAVYVFIRDSSAWSQQAYLKASNTGPEDIFGGSVALSADGNTLAVGAPWEDSGATGINGPQGNDSAEQSGAVYVFSRSGSIWEQEAYVKASNTDPGDYFGLSIALSANGNFLVVGADWEQSDASGFNGDQADNSAEESGAVYVFFLRNNAWSQQAYVKASNTEAYDLFGGSVALSADGEILAIGAAEENSSATGINGDQDDNSAPQSGAVYLY